MTPNLLNDQSLANSAIVANNRMNRQRKATGINSYEKDIGLNPIQFLENRITQSAIHWLDLCCGEGNALIETAEYFQKSYPKQSIQFTGIDLVDYFGHTNGVNNLSLKTANLSNWQPSQQYDLITIVHGLHYLGDKIGLIQKAAAALKSDGLLVGNLAIANLTIEEQIPATTLWKKYFKQNEIKYDGRKKLIQIQGTKNLTNVFIYLGANDQAGPNYTGMEVVDSFYRSE